LASSVCSQLKGPFLVFLHCFPVPPPVSCRFPFPPFLPMLAFCNPSCLCLTMQAKSLIQKITFPPPPSVYLIFLPFARVCLIFRAVPSLALPPFLCGIVYLITANHARSCRILVAIFLTFGQPRLSYKLLIASLRPHETTLFLLPPYIQVFSMNQYSTRLRPGS